MAKVWFNLGKCNVPNCGKDATWFTMKNGDVDGRVCKDHFNEIANDYKTNWQDGSMKQIIGQERQNFD